MSWQTSSGPVPIRPRSRCINGTTVAEFKAAMKDGIVRLSGCDWVERCAFVA